MKHIKDILLSRSASLFMARGERGSSEWSAFNSIQGDHVSMSSVAKPRMRIAAERKQETLTQQTLAFPAYRRQLTLKHI